MKKTFVLSAAIGVITGITGCTYNTVDYYSTSTTILPPRQPIPIMYRHDKYPETHHLSYPRNYKPGIRRTTTRVRIRPKDESKAPRFVRHVCEKCGKEYIPPYHLNHHCNTKCEHCGK